MYVYLLPCISHKYIYAYIYIFIHIYIYTYKFLYIHICTYIFIHTHTHFFIYFHINLYVHTHYTHTLKYESRRARWWSTTNQMMIRCVRLRRMMSDQRMTILAQCMKRCTGLATWHLTANASSTIARNRRWRMAKCVSVCCSVLQCVAVCCSVLQRFAVCYMTVDCKCLKYRVVPGIRNWQLETADWIWPVSSSVL